MKPRTGDGPIEVTK
ncbi:MAG: DUF3117 domain-containing protein, partial [Propionibacteriaceae bacterium]|nr:DUF3117 domain-containing protein [Propionibacteriaceae bacterium]